MASNDPSFLTRIRRALPELHPAERKLGDFLSDFPGELASYSASELADLAGVSKATVSRFVRRLGYATYEDARRHAREGQASGSRLFLAPAAAAGDPIAAHAEIGSANLRDTLARVDVPTLDAIAEAILSARRVWAIGFRASQPFASYLRWQLTQVLSQVAAIPGPGHTMGEHLASLAPDDLAIVFALRRRVAGTETLLSEITASGTPMLLISDEGMPPWPEATWHLRCQTRSNGPLFNHVAVMGLCHLIANRAIERAGAAGRERLRRIEQMNDALGEL
ncbi:MAG: MurR/RpiR family transcriptional regulator [Rhodovulum sulfidophilum]|uniref:MurR/RpiR family transcriptional regulator n=1 Tax=Rhodovulum sulfidophilum TaxID=35806 RepID=A0A2W5N7V2_RHOSU|nr:MAG: MurR/RpiR family transcriptional regulator [Rhodovulum sulfidophilum]